MNENTHFYLYAKKWYKKSNNKMNDLKIIMGKYCGMSPENVEERDVLQKLLSLSFYEINLSGNPEYLFLDFIYSIDKVGKIDACLSILDSSPSGDAGRVGLGKPSEDILPFDDDVNYDTINGFDYNWAD